MTMKNLRRFSQALFLLFFLWLFLQTESKGANELGYPVKIFLDADPLIWLTTILASRSFYGVFALALAVIIITVILGRVFCGWICPLGTLHHLTGKLQKRLKKRTVPNKQVSLRSHNLYRFKYLLLIFLMVAAIFGVQLAGLFDPLALLIRSLSLAVYPMFSYALRSLFDGVFAWNIPYITYGSEYVYGFLKKTALPFSPPLFFQGIFIGLIFFLILSMNLWEKRFWCKYLCPLGALLGLLSRYALLKRSVSEGCDGCGVCMRGCQGGACLSGNPGGAIVDKAKDKAQEWKSAECLMCLNCDDPCPKNAVSFGFSRKPLPAALDLGKRRVITSVLAGMAAAPLLRISPLAKTGVAEPTLIRPPGALAEEMFLKRCVKCGECMKVCITGGLQPTFLEAGLEGIWSPVLVPRIGYCEYRCTLCGQVCPTGAIRKLSQEEKVATKIGLAMIDKGRCLPFAHNMSCIVCEEVCPTSPKAIWFEEVRLRDRQGRETLFKQPHVDLSLCVGCGICETKCPVLGRPAITVSNLGESRSKDNQLLL
ncbi:MAG: 4Fe-4S binding protein [Syntrophus sp. (in: bacteria)]